MKNDYGNHGTFIGTFFGVLIAIVLFIYKYIFIAIFYIIKYIFKLIKFIFIKLYYYWFGWNYWLLTRKQNKGGQRC